MMIADIKLERAVVYEPLQIEDPVREDDFLPSIFDENYDDFLDFWTRQRKIADLLNKPEENNDSQSKYIDIEDGDEEHTQLPYELNASDDEEDEQILRYLRPPEEESDQQNTLIENGNNEEPQENEPIEDEEPLETETLVKQLLSQILL